MGGLRWDDSRPGRTSLNLILDEVDRVVTDGVTTRTGAGQGLDARGAGARDGRPEQPHDPAGPRRDHRLPHLSIDERLEKLEAVTLDDVQSIATDLFTGERVIGGG